MNKIFKKYTLNVNQMPNEKFPVYFNFKYSLMFAIQQISEWPALQCAI